MSDPTEEIAAALRRHFEAQAAAAVTVEDTTAGAVVTVDLTPPPDEVRVDVILDRRLVLARFDRCGSLVPIASARAAAAGYTTVLRERYVEIAMGAV